MSAYIFCLYCKLSAFFFTITTLLVYGASYIKVVGWMTMLFSLVYNVMLHTKQCNYVKSIINSLISRLNYAGEGLYTRLWGIKYLCNKTHLWPVSCNTSCMSHTNLVQICNYYCVMNNTHSRSASWLLIPEMRRRMQCMSWQ